MKIWLAQTEYAGYTLACVGSSRELAEQNLVRGLRRAIWDDRARGHRRTAGMTAAQAAEYYGISTHELTVDKPAWYLT